MAESSPSELNVWPNLNIWKGLERPKEFHTTKVMVEEQIF